MNDSLGSSQTERNIVVKPSEEEKINAAPLFMQHREKRKMLQSGGRQCVKMKTFFRGNNK